MDIRDRFRVETDLRAEGAWIWVILKDGVEVERSDPYGTGYASEDAARSASADYLSDHIQMAM